MKVILSESQFKMVLNEFYDPEKLYLRDHIVQQLKKGPRYMHQHIKNLPNIECTDNQGNMKICTRIPQVVYQFLFGNF